MRKIDMGFFTVRKLILTGLLTMFSGSFRSLSADPAADLHAFNYHIETDIRWTDGFSRPAAPDKNEGLTSPASGSSTSLRDEDYHAEPIRSPALTLLRLRGTWALRGKSQLSFSLRPDALLYRGEKTPEARAYDSRAGTVYQPLPPVEFLESYQIRSDFGPGVSWSIGVYEYLSKPTRSYPELLGFGPFVLFPRNMFGVRLSWHQLSGYPAEIQSVLKDVSLLVYQGPSDRSEHIAAKDSSFDSGPGGIDPYYGGALRVSFRKTRSWKTGLLLAYHEAGKSGARERSAYAEGFLRYTFRSGLWLNDQSLNVRYNRNSWHVEGQDYIPLNQFSFTLSNQTRVFENQNLLLGLSIGRAELHPEVSTSQKLVYYGHQLELGWRYEIHQGLVAFALISEEHREKINLNHEIELGFHNDSEERKMLRRIALGISYSLNGS